MTKIPKYWIKAKKHLSKKDRVISKLINDYKSPSETILTSRKDIFFSLQLKTCMKILGYCMKKGLLKEKSLNNYYRQYRSFQRKCL